jgi:hypothetical protein
MLAELIRRENVLMVEEDELWEAYARAVDVIENCGPSGVMQLQSPSGAVRHFLRRYDGNHHVLVVVMPASLLVHDPRYRVLAVSGPRGRPLAPLVVPQAVSPVRRHRPGHAELASLAEAERVVEATLQAYYHPRNYLTRVRAFFGV